MCNIANDERRSSVIVFRSGVFNLFIKLKLRSAAHDETGYVNCIDSWVECSISYIVPLQLRLHFELLLAGQTTLHCLV